MITWALRTETVGWPIACTHAAAEGVSPSPNGHAAFDPRAASAVAPEHDRAGSHARHRPPNELQGSVGR